MGDCYIEERDGTKIAPNFADIVHARASERKAGDERGAQVLKWGVVIVFLPQRERARWVRAAVDQFHFSPQHRTGCVMNGDIHGDMAIELLLFIE